MYFSVLPGCYAVIFYDSHYWLLLCSFFFFKQKTAYDMRISDWSSDVCSSDLQFGSISERLSDRFGTRGLPVTLSTACASGATAIQLGVEEIGRASCRERVCQYV